MRKLLVVVGLVCTVSAVLVASAASFEDNGDFVRRRAIGAVVRRIERQLNITDHQREQIRGILKTEQPTIQALAIRARQEREQLNSRHSFDEAWVRTFAQQHASTTEDALVERQRVRAEIIQVLTPEQRKKAERVEENFSVRILARLTTIDDEL